ncbi:MAG TPA: hypothetical protein VIQ22_07490 [Gammaproteobacteria bacterium]
MKIEQLLKQWEQRARDHQPLHELTLRLPRYELAKVHALQEMYPGKSSDELLAELLITALHELEATFPYIAGDRVVAEDEDGDPIFEDVGPTPRFIELTHKHAARLAEGGD